MKAPERYASTLQACFGVADGIDAILAKEVRAHQIMRHRSTLGVALDLGDRLPPLEQDLAV